MAGANRRPHSDIRKQSAGRGSSGEASPSIVMDISMSVAPQGKIGLHLADGKPLPMGWIFDRLGRYRLTLPTLLPVLECRSGAIRVTAYGRHHGDTRWYSHRSRLLPRSPTGTDEAETDRRISVICLWQSTLNSSCQSPSSSRASTGWSSRRIERRRRTWKKSSSRVRWSFARARRTFKKVFRSGQSPIEYCRGTEKEPRGMNTELVLVP